MTKKKFYIAVGLPMGILVAVLIIFGLYVGLFHFGNRALPGVQVGTLKVSGMNAEQIEKHLNKIYSTTTVSFDAQPKKEFTLSDLGYEIDTKATIAKVMDYSKGYKNYFRAIFKNYVVEPVYKIDNKKVLDIANALSKGHKDAKTAVEPVLKYDKNEQVFVVEKGTDGYGATTDSVIKAAVDAMKTTKSIATKIEFGPIKPITDVEIAKKVADNATSILNIKINIATSVEDKQFSVDKDTIASWVLLPKLGNSKTIEISNDKVSQWVNKVADDINVSTTNGKKYVTPSGKVLRTDPGHDGVKVTNAKAVSDGIINALKQNKNYSDAFKVDIAKASWVTYQVPEAAANLAYVAAPDEKWIDINLSKYTITGYIGAKAVLGPYAVGVGDTSKGYHTPTGVYKVFAKVPVQDMSGFNSDGSRYLVRDIRNVMYFHGDYAIHAARWVNEDIQKMGHGYETSHGCVSMPTGPVDLSELFYNWTPMGTAVASHH